ncbi:uncharacterized protein MEPE_00608 [Melanopsichium pennsylvanicum]|uniref:Pali-domain-containing protein n=2 Tax=Melanopsichium pennsylvanicum TaxID=63383 RepID=A0AAJ4XGV1_9BASI|nr:conserved hypothetical protein [Melanopsichium pennsylvanicum 4]SNX81903.1 uncharacterized protein MEPE_00608 [Melanopsichium pennsylvanicum]
MFRPATPGTLLTLIAAILLGLVTISTPIIKGIYFLEATIGGSGSQNGQTARLGTLGYCIGDTCSSPTLGYSFDPNQLLGIQVISSKYTSAVIKGLTYTLILHPIALAFAVVSVLLGLISHCRELSTNCFGTFVTGIGAFVTIVAFGLDLALFIIAKKRIDSINGASAQLGTALWMTLAAWILMFLAGCAFSCGICSRRNRNRVKDSHLPPESYGARPAAPMQDRYTDQMRMDAIDAEADRKRRQATLDRNNRRREDLPKFAEYETEYEVPLKNDYEDGAYENGATLHQPSLAYSTNSDIARAGAGAAAGMSVINGVGQGYGRRQAQGSWAEDFSSSPPMLNNSAGYGAHNINAQRQNTILSVGEGNGIPQSSIMSNAHSDATYIPGVGPQPFREDSLTPAPRSYPQVSSPPPMPDPSQHHRYQSQSQQPQYDAYGSVVPTATGGSQFSQQNNNRRQPTAEYGHPTEYSGATFGPSSSGFQQQDPNSGSRMRGPRNLPVIPQHETVAEPEEIVYGGTANPADRRQGTIDDGFGLASVAHGSQQPHETRNEGGYDHYASSAYDHQQQHQQHQPQFHNDHPSQNQYEEAGAGSSSAGGVQGYRNQQGTSHYDDYQSSAGPPGYESVAGGSDAYAHNHYPQEKH